MMTASTIASDQQQTQALKSIKKGRQKTILAIERVPLSLAPTYLAASRSRVYAGPSERLCRHVRGVCTIFVQLARDVIGGFRLLSWVNTVRGFQTIQLQLPMRVK